MKVTAKKKTGKFYIALFCAILIFVVFHGAKAKPFEGFVHFVTEPFSKFFSNTGRFANEKFGFAFSIGSLKNENKTLLEENLKLKTQIASLQDIKNENAQLREQLELAPRDSYDLKAGMIIGRDISSTSEEFVIDVGSKDGIKERMAVVVGEGVLVGKVKRVLHSVSYVEPILSKNSRVNAEIVETEAKGIVRGQFGTGVVIDMIPQTVEVNKGDSVITSGVGGILPRGILIGYAQDPIPTADQLFQQSSLVLPVDVNSTRMVWVVTGIK